MSFPPGDGLAALPALRDVIERDGLRAKRQLGQNFLLDGNLTDKIVRSAGVMPGANVIEIGPGPGGLTRSLLRSDLARLFVVETDERCRRALEEIAVADQRLDIRFDDALGIDLAGLGVPPRLIVANLPYNIATPLLIKWLKSVNHFCGFTLMFQREVAERLAAKPGQSAYGRLSVISQWLCDVRIAFDVPPRAFVPAPKVMSTVVHLIPRAERDTEIAFTDLESVTQAAFGQRRKMLRSSLKNLVGDPEKLLSRAGIDSTRRPETLSIDEFCSLTNIYAQYYK